MLKSRITFIVGFLFLLNFLGILIWPLDLVTVRLSLWSFSGLTLLILFLIYTNDGITTLLKIFLALFLIFGFINAEKTNLALIIFDLCFWGILGSVFLIRKVNYTGLAFLIKVIIIASISFFIITIPYMNYSVLFTGESYSRKDTAIDILSGNRDIGYYIYLVYGMIYSLLGTILLFLPLMRNSMRSWLVRIIFFAIIAVYVLYSLYFLKRQALVELFAILLIYIFLYKKLYSFIIPTTVLKTILSISIVLIVSSSLIFSSLFDRFNEGIQDIGNFDRLNELELVFSDFTQGDYLFGKGIAYKYKEGYGGGSIVHIGFANIVFKGGFLLLFFYLVNIYKNVFYCLKMTRSNPNFIIGVGFSVFTFIHLLIAPGYGSTINVIFIGLGLFSRYPLTFLLKNNRFS